MTTKIIPQYPNFIGASNPLTLCVVQGVVAVSVLVPNAPKSSSHASPEAEQEVSANTCMPDNTSNYLALWLFSNNFTILPLIILASKSERVKKVPKF